MTPSLLFIPDITGFTKFVNDTEVAHGQHIVAELLELIIDSDRLGMTVSEVEGDAVLFIRHPSSSFEMVLEQARVTFEAFHQHIKSYETRRICKCGACRTAHGLSLKMIAHAGPVEIVAVHGFQKPYGSDVVLAHLLLKNDVPESEYVLITRSISEVGEAAGTALDSGSLPEWAEVIDGATEYDDFGTARYRYVPLEPLRASIPDPPPRPVFEKTDNPIATELVIDRPVSEVYELVTNFEARLLWNHDAEELTYEEGRVNRVGTKHNCLVHGTLLEFETITADFGEDRLVYGERILDSPLVDDVAFYYILESEGDSTRVRLEVHYRPRPFPRNLIAPVFRFVFGRMMLPRVLRSIKQVAEQQPEQAGAGGAPKLAGV